VLSGIIVFVYLANQVSIPSDATTLTFGLEKQWAATILNSDFSKQLTAFSHHGD
jgi:hypothetical protein